MDETLRLEWNGDMAFSAHTVSGHTVQLDAATSDGGGNAAPQPTEFLLIALAGCAGMDVIAILKKKRQPVEGLRLLVTAERASELPRAFTTIKLEYLIRGNVQAEAIERAIELTETKYCPVHATLAPTVNITHSYRFDPPPPTD